MSRKLTTDEFINRSKIIHKNVYDYSRVNYQGMNKKVEIICSNHGSFFQNAGDHIGGKKCRKCSKNILSQEEFIEKCKNIHQDKYDYSLVGYKTKGSMIIIICPIHGEFPQLAGNHLKGHGCLQCSSTSPMTTESFIKKANEIHNNQYLYERTIFNKKEKVTITCKSHGDFLQTPNNHLRNHGCPSCSNMRSRLEERWIESFNNPNIIPHHTLNIVGNKSIIADGYDPTTNTVYEFWGDFWHGNPDKYDQDEINPRTKKTFGELYQLTLDKIESIKSSDYILIDIWENDFNQ